MKSLLIVSLCFLMSAAEASWRNYKDPSGPLYQGTYSEGSVSTKKEFRTITMNIHYSQHIDELVARIKSDPFLNDVDAFLLQEITGEPGQDLEHAAEKIAKKLNLNYVYVPAFIHKENEKDFGVAILSPHPLSSLKKIILPHPHFLESTQRVAVGATVETSAGDVRVYSIHAETVQFYIWRHHQVREVMRDANNYAEYPTIIGGDFNTAPVWQRWTLFKYAGKKGWDVASRNVRGATFRGVGGIRLRLDHIFSRNAVLLNAGKLPGGHISNHDFVWADFAP